MFLLQTSSAVPDTVAVESESVVHTPLKLGPVTHQGMMPSM